MAEENSADETASGSLIEPEESTGGGRDDLQMILQELRVTGPKPPLESLPQTIVVKCSSFKTKEEVLKLARQRKRFVHQ